MKGIKIIKIRDTDGIIYHLNAKHITGWFYSKGRTGITTDHGWNYTIDGDIVDMIDRAMLNETGKTFNLTAKPIKRSDDNDKSDDGIR